MVVMVAGDDYNLAARAERLADRAQHRPGRAQRISDRAVPQLQNVTEQHETIDAPERVEQPLTGLLAAQHVAPGVRAEMQVGDDQRAQRTPLSLYEPAAAPAIA